MKKYQFKFLICSRYNIEQSLNEYGELGYRPIHVNEENGTYTVLLENEFFDFSVEDVVNTPYRTFGISKLKEEETK